MSTHRAGERLELLQGTIDLLILRTLIFGAQHGQGIARALLQPSEKELLVEHGVGDLGKQPESAFLFAHPHTAASNW